MIVDLFCFGIVSLELVRFDQVIYTLDVLNFNQVNYRNLEFVSKKLVFFTYFWMIIYCKFFKKNKLFANKFIFY